LKWLVITQDHEMPKNFLRNTLDQWLAHSAARFRYPLRLVLQRKRYVELQFSGITPAIRCAISTEGMVGIYTTYQGEWWDSLAEFDVVARRMATDQYYCGLCPSPEMFASRAALWVAHSFEPFLTWTNTHFQSSQWLWLCRVGGMTWAGLKPMEALHSREIADHPVYACPVVRGKPSTTAGP
jgi:DNA-binding transcriptional LysR family regulator